MNYKYVCFNISSRCNMNCPYCYRVGCAGDRGDVDSIVAQRYIDYLVENGCSAICITGGEPLLNPRWRDIVDYCRKKELFVNLSTNGIGLDIEDDTLKKIQCLSLPLDGSCERINECTRSKRQFRDVARIVKKYDVNKYPFRLKINTVITQYNLEDLPLLQRRLNKEGVIWKLFKLRKKGEHFHLQDDKVPSEEELEKALVKLSEDYDLKCRRYYMGGESGDINPNYYVLDWNGNMYLATETDNILLFNVDDENKTFDDSDYRINNQYSEELKDAFE